MLYEKSIVVKKLPNNTPAVRNVQYLIDTFRA